MVEISKADWKLLRERIGNWQERYMEKLSKEYVKLLTSPGNASNHFWELEKRIKQDKKHPGVLIEMNMGKVIWDINRRFGRDGVRMPRQQIYDMPFGKVYDCLIAKAERKGHTRDEVDELAKGKAVDKIKRG